MHLGFIEDTKLHGGTQLWVYEAIQFYIIQGIEITLLTPANGWLAKECKNDSINLVTYDYKKITTKDFTGLKIWIKALKHCDVAICTVHPPRENFHCSIFAAKCIKKANLKTYLVTKTGTVVPTYRREFYLPDQSIRSSIITIINSTKIFLIQNYNIPADMIKTIYQGIDIERFSSNADRISSVKTIFPLGDSSPVLGCIGSLEQRKGQLLLLKALLKLISKDLPKIHLLIVGDGPDKRFLRETVIDLELESNVTFIPFTREPVKIYERIDILVLPSLYKEGLPNVVLESLAMDKPVIASDLGGISEVVKNGKNGYLVELGNIDHLAEAIKNMWSDRTNYRSLCDNARQAIEKKFHRTAQFKKFLEYFHNLSMNNEGKSGSAVEKDNLEQ